MPHDFIFFSLWGISICPKKHTEHWWEFTTPAVHFFQYVLLEFEQRENFSFVDPVIWKTHNNLYLTSFFVDNMYNAQPQHASNFPPLDINFLLE